METVDQVGHFVEFGVIGTKSGQCRIFPCFFDLIDSVSCEFKSLTGNTIYRGTYETLDRPDSNADSQLEGLQAPSEIQNQPGDRVRTECYCLKFISGRDCVRKSDEFVIQLRDAGDSKLLVQRGTKVRVRARFDHIRNENAVGAILRLHIYVQ